jgi:hypothetical protein
LPSLSRSETPVWISPETTLCRCETGEDLAGFFDFTDLEPREKDCPEARDNSQFPPLVERWQSGLTRTPGKRE